MKKVKTLAWKEDCADTLFGLYYSVAGPLNGDSSLWLASWTEDFSVEIGGRYPSKQDAKEAAQKHFETEILKWVE